MDDDFVSAPKAGNVHAADVRSDPVRPVPGRHDYVGVFHARGQYVYAAQMRVPLIGVWSDEDIRYSKNGNIRGVYVDVQVDQSTMRPSDVARGRGYGSSSIQSVYGDRDAESVGKIYFPKRQFDIIMVAGIQASYGATYGCSFTGDVFVRETITSKHKLAPFVFVPTDGLGGDGDAFCEEHRPFGSMHVSFDGNDLKNQLEVTSAARSRDMRTDVSKENHSFLAAVENGGAYPGPSEPEEQSDHSFS